MYGFGIISSAQKANNHQLSIDESKKLIRQSQKKINLEWSEYFQTIKDAPKEQLNEDTSALIKQSNLTIDKLLLELDKHNNSSLNATMVNELYPNINPILAKLTQLINYKIEKIQALYIKNNANYNSTTYKLGILILIFILFGIIFSYYLVRHIKNLMDNLRLSEEKYKYLFNNNPAYIIIWDLESLAIVNVNDTVIEKYGYSYEEWMCMTVIDYRPKDDHEKIKAFAKKAIDSSEPILAGRWTHYKKNGEEMQMEITSHKIIYNDRKAILSLANDITEQLKIEKKLKESEEKYRSFIENAPDAIFVFSDNNAIQYTNYSASELLGYSDEEFQKIKKEDLYAPGDYDFFLSQIDEKSYLIETRLKRKDGSKVDVEISRKIISSEQEHIVIVRNITKRKIIEAELIERKEQLSLFIEHSPASLAMVDTELRYIATSKRWVKDYNLGNQNLIGKSHYEIFPELPQHWKEIHQRSLKGSVEKSDEDVFIRADGGKEWLKWEIRQWHKANGEIGGLIFFTEVITERKKASELFKYQFENSPDIILTINKFNTIESINKSFFGMHPIDKLIGMDCIFILPYENHESTRKIIEKCFKTGENQEIEMPLQNGIWLKARFVPIKIETIVSHVMIFAIDITEQKNAKEELIKNNIELKKTNSELDRFVYSTSHDLRAPLKSMLGLINIAKENIEPDNVALKELFKMLDKSAAKLDDFIEDILHYSRNTRMEVETEVINFENTIQEAIDNTKFIDNNNKPNINIKLDIEEKFISDNKRIAVVLNNILSNSMKYQDTTKDNHFINISVKTDTEKAVIVIEDNGIGIDQDNKEKVFEMFYRATSLSSGTGLGLYIVKETLEKINGKINMESKFNIGTKFTIEIPNLITSLI
jgi:PAS domain S-box-containing protein